MAGVSVWSGSPPGSPQALHGSDYLATMERPTPPASPIYDGAHDLLRKERELLEARAEDGEAATYEREDYWRRDGEMDEALTTYEHSVVQSYTPVEPTQHAAARLCAPPSEPDPSRSGAGPAPHAAIVVSSLATLGPKPKVHFTEHDRRRKAYLTRRLSRQLGRRRRPNERTTEDGGSVMEVVHGPGTVIGKGVPDLRVPFGQYYDAEWRSHRGIDAAPPPANARAPPSSALPNLAGPISPQQSVSLASFMMASQAPSYPGSGGDDRGPRPAVQRHRFQISPSVSLSQALVEGYRPSPSAVACDAVLRGNVGLAGRSPLSGSLSSAALAPRRRTKPPRVLHAFKKKR